MAAELEDVDDMSVDSCADCFGSDLQRLENTHWKAGYREGVSDGQESTLQKGFNEGFAEAARQYMTTSKLRGFLSALIIYLKMDQKRQTEESCLATLEDCIKQLSELEARDPEIDETVFLKNSNEFQPRKNSINKLKDEDLKSAIELMDCVTMEEHGIGIVEEQKPCCRDGNSCKNSKSENFKDGNTDMNIRSDCPCNEGKEILQNAAFSEQPNGHSVSRLKQRLKPLSHDFHWNKLQSALENSRIPKNVIEKLQFILD